MELLIDIHSHLDHCFFNEDRQKAITVALQHARKGDSVIITGKGHEKSLCRGTKEYPWSDQTAVNNALKAIE